MDAEPKALRISILLTIAFVLFGIIAIAFLFILRHDTERTGGTLAGAELDAVSTRSMPPSKALDAATAARVNQLTAIVMTSVMPAGRRAAADGLVSIGRNAVPSMLDAVHRLTTGAGGFEPVPAREQMENLDDALVRIRLASTPSSPADPMPADPNPTWLLRRAKSWFVWWDAYASAHPEVR